VSSAVAASHNVAAQHAAEFEQRQDHLPGAAPRLPGDAGLLHAAFRRHSDSHFAITHSVLSNIMLLIQAYTVQEVQLKVVCKRCSIIK